mmetsp:Transcript_355/g.1379  ORF Transcript_355/g.1379 Transcript_355/m.1379 type:complete len:107 (-) Transcript_355:43-363(-)
MSTKEESKPEVSTGERKRQTFMEKLTNEPLVPLGSLVTVACLVGAMSAFRAKNPYRMNRMMQGRVLAQFFTVGAIVVGAGMGLRPTITDRSDERFRRPEEKEEVKS